MARHRRQTKRRSYNKNRRTSRTRKMRGGVAETDRQILAGLGFTEQNINYLIANNPDMLIEFVQNSINPPLDASGNPSNRFFTEAQTPAQFMADMMANNESFDNSVQNRTPSPNRRRFDPMSQENNYVSDYEQVTPTRLFNSDDSFGGKRKSKSNKRKIRKTRKMRKIRRNRRQQGGRGFTTEEEINPLAYLDQREISEANMPRP